MYFNPPKGVCDEAKQFYSELVGNLESQAIIQQLDATILELAVTSYHVFITARESILTNGVTYPVKGMSGDILQKVNPAFKVMTDSQIQILKIITELGLSPKSRKSLKDQPIGNAPATSPLMDWLKNPEYK